LDLSGTLQGAGGVGGLLWQDDNITHEKSFALYDNNGNITKYIKPDYTLGANYNYDAFLNGSTGTAYRFQASTKSWNNDLGLLDYQFRAYSPTLGRWIQEDPIQENGGINLYAFVNNNAIGYIDYMGFLRRAQVDYLAYKFVKDWKGVGPANRGQIKTAISTIIKELNKIAPGQFNLKGYENKWSDTYDYRLQKLIDERADLFPEFPGKIVDKCFDCKKLKKIIDDAKNIYSSNNMTDIDVFAWVARESGWDFAASPYGRESAGSTAEGLLQITMSTWNDMSKRVIKKGETLYGKSWQDVVSAPTTSIAAGLRVLDSKKNGLYDYHGAAIENNGRVLNKEYQDSILKASSLISKGLNGRSIEQLNTKECQALLNDLKKFYAGSKSGFEILNNN